MANLGLVQALAGRGDWLVCDELNHASLIDAARLSRAEIHIYPHNDADAAARLLELAPADARKFILTDGVFSMDGDLAPLARLSALAREHEGWLIVDDAHGTGVVGPGGRGACAEAGVAGDHVIQMVTLSKALGSQGGAVTGSRASLKRS
jgi:8-amino-7-oxononanoate synthase